MSQKFIYKIQMSTPTPYQVRGRLWPRP